MSQTPAAAPAPSPTAGSIPIGALTAVLMGTFISTLTGRLSSLGVADIRGSLHVGFDEGAWITTAQTVAQMMVAPIAVWAGAAFGPRRVLFEAAAAFGCISLILPLAPNYAVFLALQFASGLASGFFIPLTLSFVMRNTSPRFWALGIALYALNLEFSLNIAASLEAFYIDHLTWQWIFWQNAPLAFMMAFCLHWGCKREAVPATRPKADVYGFASGALGLGLVCAGLDQGNRLDWLNSGLVVGLVAGGLILVAAFILNEARSDHPGLNLKVVFSGPMIRILGLIAVLRVTLLGTSYLIPTYLQGVRGFRALEVGQALLWVALPQLLFCPLAALMLRRTDARLVSCVGFGFIAVACYMVGHGLTPAWGPDQFLRSQLLQAIGQSFALSGILFYGVLFLKPQDALTFGAGTQIARLMGGEIGQAFVVTLTRVRSQTGSYNIGVHVQNGGANVVQRLQTYSAALAQGSDPGRTAGRATGVLAGAVRTAAATQGVIDSFIAVCLITGLALAVAAASSPAPEGPASHKPLFHRRKAASA